MRIGFNNDTMIQDIIDRNDKTQSGGRELEVLKQSSGPVKWKCFPLLLSPMQNYLTVRTLTLRGEVANTEQSQDGSGLFNVVDDYSGCEFNELFVKSYVISYFFDKFAN